MKKPWKIAKINSKGLMQKGRKLQQVHGLSTEVTVAHSRTWRRLRMTRE